MARVRKPTSRSRNKKQDTGFPEIKSVKPKKKAAGNKGLTASQVATEVTKQIQPLFKEIRSLTDALQVREESMKGPDKSDSEIIEINQKHEQAVKEVNKRAPRQKIPIYAADKKGEDYLIKGIHAGMSSLQAQSVVENVLSSDTNSEVIKEWQIRTDKMRIRCALLTPRGSNMISAKQTKAWAEHEEFLQKSGIEKVLNLGNIATDFVPQGWSMELLSYYYAALQIGSAFETFPMPHSPYTYPIVGEVDVFYRVDPNASARGTAANELTADDPEDGQTTFTARKITARLDLSDDLVEDSVDMLLDSIMQIHIPNAMKRGVENAIINGDRTATHQDSGVAAGDVRKAWQGLRKDALERGATFDIEASSGTFDFGDFSRLLEVGGHYFDRPEDCGWVLPTVLSHRIKRFTQLETLDKYEMPTNYHGHVGYILGSPVFTSAEYPNAMDDDGTISATAADNVHTGFTAFNRVLYQLGERRMESIGWHRDPLTQFYHLVSDCRKDFQPRENRRAGFTPALSAVNVTV